MHREDSLELLNIFIDQMLKLHSNYLQATTTDVFKLMNVEDLTDEQSEQLMSLIEDQYYYLGQTEAFENIKNYITQLSASGETVIAETAYAETVN